MADDGHDLAEPHLRTTLAKIIAGLYQPEAGNVRWDSTAVADVDSEQLRERISVIAQDHANWPLTVRHNITMGRAVHQGMLSDAVAAAEADTVIDSLPHSYDTLLDRRFKEAAELSGGREGKRRPQAQSLRDHELVAVSAAHALAAPKPTTTTSTWWSTRSPARRLSGNDPGSVA